MEADAEQRKDRTLIQRIKLQKNDAGDPIHPVAESQRLRNEGIQTTELPIHED